MFPVVSDQFIRLTRELAFWRVTPGCTYTN